MPDPQDFFLIHQHQTIGFIFANVDIRIENIERIPRGENVIFAMNHTNRFNYWPFQYRLWKMREFPFTTVWVKAKYYKNAFLAKGLDLCNMIPVPSMGYLIEEFYRRTFHRKMDKGLYRGEFHVPILQIQFDFIGGTPRTDDCSGCLAMSHPLVGRKTSSRWLPVAG